MSRYIALCADAGSDLVIPDRLQARVAGQEAWDWALQTPRIALLAPVARRPRFTPLPDQAGIIIGDVFTRSGLHASDLAERLTAEGRQDPERLCQSLIADYWGGYVALLAGAEGDWWMLRDPSGALEALTWRSGPLRIVASDLPEALIAAVAPKLAIDWERLAQVLVHPVSLGGDLPLRGLQAVAPGQVLVGATGSARTVWSPAKFAQATPPPSDRAKAQWVRLVDKSVAALAQDRGPILAEVSGGLDSAIVAASLARIPHLQVAQWLNYYAPERESDERGYALDVSQLHGFELTAAPKGEVAVSLEALASGASSVRPSLIGLDAWRDADVTERCAKLGIGAIFTGQGGDAVFLQRFTPMALGDQMRAKGIGSLTPARLADLALWTGRSVWSVLFEVLRPQRRSAQTLWGPAWLAQDIRRRAAPRQPWLADLEAIAPGKRQQIERLVQSQLVVGDCQRRRQADLIHPLLSQPVVEYALSIPTYDLTDLKRDRAMVRSAFAARVPDTILHRRSKGDMTAYYGRRVVASLPFLRPFLLDGRLAAAGLIDRAALDGVLTPERLVWGGDYVAILYAAVLEAWVGYWEARTARGAG